MPTLSEQEVIIKIRNLSKSYILPHGKRVYALDHIDLNIHKGEAIGIIGSNGSGKSTLLKILSKITAPDEGTVEITGKTASILEVGTGFNPDLSGKKNIYLNARLHGMKKQEVDKKFDSIVSLFGFPDFLDTPIKQYSNGMYMRLAFAVVVHINADIYAFDEVMSVGDIEFQQKAQIIMQELKKNGKTLLIVTHHLNRIDVLCDRLCLISNGKIKQTGSPYEIGTIYAGRSKFPELRMLNYITNKSTIKKYNGFCIESITKEENDKDIRIHFKIESDEMKNFTVFRFVLNRVLRTHSISICSNRLNCKSHPQKFNITLFLNKSEMLNGQYFFDLHATDSKNQVVSVLCIYNFSIENPEYSENKYWVLSENKCFDIEILHDENTRKNR